MNYNDSFSRNHKIGDIYLMVNRDKTVEECKIAYYPLDYEQPTALIEIARNGYNDFREVPIVFLTKKP